MSELSDAQVTQVINAAQVANWSVSLLRYYFLDYDAGNDSNVGYIDAAANSTFTGGQTSAVAIKTMERLREIVPKNGNGRGIVILQKLRASSALYQKKDGITTDGIDTSLWYGYSGGFLWRGSTDLSNDAADKITCGFRIAVAGPGGSSEFTVAGGATTTVVPISAGTIGAEAATEYRIRFLPTTTTVALRNICSVIVSGVVNTSVTCATLPATPAAGDVFVIERPGVLVGTLNYNATGLTPLGGPGGSLVFIGPQIAGFGFSTTAVGGVLLGPGTGISLCGCEQIGSTTNTAVIALGAQTLTVRERYFDEAVGTQTLGMGFRCNCAATIGRNFTMDVQCWGSMNTAATLTLRPGQFGDFGAFSYLGGNFNVTGTATTGVNETTGTSSIMFQLGDPVSTNPQPRVIGSGAALPFQVVDAPCNLWRLNFESGFSAATHGCIYLKHIVGGAMNIDGCTGSGGNPQVGVEVLQCSGLTLSMGATIANTVTGTVGDIKTAGGAIMSHTDLTKVGFRDPSGNVLIGTAGLTQGDTIVVTNNEGSALAPGNTVYLTAASTVKKTDATLAVSAVFDGIVVTTTANGALGLMSKPDDGNPYVLVDASVTAPALLYLSVTTKGTLTSTVPPVAGTNQKLRAGRAITTSSTAVRAALNPELLPTTSNGTAP